MSLDYIFSEKVKMSFQARLKELREAAKFSQDELAQRAGMSRGGVAQLETGRRKPGWDTLRKLADALGVTIEAFAEAGEAAERPPQRGRPRKPASDEATAPTAPEPKPVKGKRGPKGGKAG